MATACSLTESAGNSRSTLSCASACRCSPCRWSLARCSLGCAGGRDSCALATVAAPATSSANSARVSLVILGMVVAGVVIEASFECIDPAGAPRLGRTIADIVPPAQIFSSVDIRRDIGECRAFPALRRTKRNAAEDKTPRRCRKNAVSQGLARARTIHGPRPDPGSRRANLRAPTRRLGRQRHQDRVTARARRRRPARRPARRVGLSESAPQQAQHDAQSQGTRRPWPRSSAW